MRHGMHFGDFLDLQWFLEQDRTVDPALTQERDRDLGLEARRGSVSADGLVPFWLARRREEAADPAPSVVLASVMTALRWVLALGGLLAGASLVRGLLAYTGVEPVNVSVFLLLAVLPQAALCLLAAAVFLLRGRAGMGVPAVLRPLLALPWRRERLAAQAGFFRALVLGRGWAAPMLAWDCLGVLHLGGLCLALGSLVGVLVSVAVTDLAFGWQSTLQVGSEGMLALVSALALPWSWLPADWGLIPTLAQIEGSRIVLKDGMATLANRDLVAWWPFLGMCLGLYALLPRIVLLAMARRTLGRLERDFVHPDLARVADRMRLPILASTGDPETVSTPLPLAAEVSPAGPESCAPAVPELAGCVLLLPPELDGLLGVSELAVLARRVCGHHLSRVLPAELQETGIVQALAQCADLVWSGDHERFVVLVEAWQPPIRENLRALLLLGQGRGSSRSLTLVLTGRPSPGRWLVAPDATQHRAWAEAVERLAPLRVDIFGAEP